MVEPAKAIVAVHAVRNEGRLAEWNWHLASSLRQEAGHLPSEGKVAATACLCKDGRAGASPDALGTRHAAGQSGHALHPEHVRTTTTASGSSGRRGLRRLCLCLRLGLCLRLSLGDGSSIRRIWCAERAGASLKSSGWQVPLTRQAVQASSHRRSHPRPSSPTVLGHEAAAKVGSTGSGLGLWHNKTRLRRERRTAASSSDLGQESGLLSCAIIHGGLHELLVFASSSRQQSGRPLETTLRNFGEQLQRI